MMRRWRMAAVAAATGGVRGLTMITLGCFHQLVGGKKTILGGGAGRGHSELEGGCVMGDIVS